MARWMMNRNKKIAVALVGGLLLVGSVFALSDGDYLLTQDYVDDTLVPQMEEAVESQIQDYLGEVYTDAVAELDAVNADAMIAMGLEGVFLSSSAITPMDFGQGDTITLTSGASLLVTNGRMSLTHSGTVIDATTGETVSSGSYTTAYHRYIVAEDTTLTATVVSGLAKLGYAGQYSYTSGTGKNQPFYDVYSFDSYNDAVTFVYNNGLFNGMGDGLFEPAGSMTRAMVMTVLYRLAGEPADQMAAATGSFTDVSADQWYADYVSWGASQGVTSGMGDGTFAPDSGVTLVQMIQFLYNFGSNNLGLNLSGTANLSVITGGDTVPSWGEEAAQWAVSSGVWTATLADRTAMRAEVATMLENFSRIYG